VSVRLLGIAQAKNKEVSKIKGQIMPLGITRILSICFQFSEAKVILLIKKQEIMGGHIQTTIPDFIFSLAIIPVMTTIPKTGIDYVIIY